MINQNIPDIRSRIQALMPGLAIEHIEANQEGLVNEVFIVNRQYVFRFARTLQAVTILDLEMKILDLVRSQLMIEVPTPIQRRPDAIVYPLLPGQPLTRPTLHHLDEPRRLAIAAQLGSFLSTLHTTPLSDLDWQLPATLAPVTRDRWLDIRQRTQGKIYPLLLPHQRQWAENLFDSALHDPDFFDYQPALIHGDLAPYHILYDDQRQGISGIIDFGVAGLGDTALDLGSLLSTYGESFVAQMAQTYPNLEVLLPRARFYAQSIELQWVLLGLETGEAFWFTAHLGGAREIHP
jgi:aminoglycoside 2''-phosphotransferase